MPRFGPPHCALSVYVHIATIGLVFALFSQIDHLNQASTERGEEGGEDNVAGNMSDRRVVGSWVADQKSNSPTTFAHKTYCGTLYPTD